MATYIDEFLSSHLCLLSIERINFIIMTQNTFGKEIHVIDLNFMGISGAIASYLIPHSHGAILVESGPGSTLPALEAGLKAHGVVPGDVTDVLLTHIHLDHAGAAGWLARQGARIHVHEVGAPHLLDPAKLLTSAGRLYGDMMGVLWGECLPVPEGQLSILRDGQVVEIEELSFRALETPGHAYHHFAYLFAGVCFSGDIGGVRLQGQRHLRLPMPPPEFHLENWRRSLDRLQKEFEQGKINQIAPTHFGLFSDPQWHLASLRKELDEVEQWLEAVMPADPPIETLNDLFLQWTQRRSLAQGLEESVLNAYETANPSWMSPYGMQRYWRKHRSGG